MKWDFNDNHVIMGDDRIKLYHTGRKTYIEQVQYIRVEKRKEDKRFADLLDTSKMVRLYSKEKIIVLSKSMMFIPLTTKGDQNLSQT